MLFYYSTILKIFSLLSLIKYSNSFILNTHFLFNNLYHNKLYNNLNDNICDKNLYNNLFNGGKLFNWCLYATKSKLKAVRKFTRDRPKKTTPAAIYPSPTLYYGNVHDHFGAPPEYLAIPVQDTLDILRNGKLSELISLLKSGITGSELSKVLSDNSFHADLTKELNTIKEISEFQNDDVSNDLYLYFEPIINKPEEYEHYVDKFYTFKKLQSYWAEREQKLYNTILRQLFSRLRSIAYKLKDTGLSLTEFANPTLWHKYGVFKPVPNCKMVENYLTKHQIAINFDIKNLYFRDENNEIKSNFENFYSKLYKLDDSNTTTDTESSNNTHTNNTDTNINTDNNSTVEDSYSLYDDKGVVETAFSIDENGKLPSDLVDRIVDDLTDLGVLNPKEPWTINLSRIEELQEQFTSEKSQHAYAIRDFYLSLKFPHYQIETDPYILESYVNHQYRTKTYERDLLVKYNNWLKSGAPRETFKPMNVKYKHMAIWHSLSKNQRRRLVQKYVKTQTTPVTQPTK
ncbi:hypothetical protein TpMuguga_01g00020 [Theileria parva strain Muguga]|uniref:Plasmodium RESA N-terminal domain-containing protein n=1 Tax=Theileria parva TaxID=5875 RepID=Q4N9V3_THEPA|nr:uncharacterized protein TpMuguga_01g00020 [Theileria parva strain Muguga]EAN33264.1 hypothetical protein TpMuguga_01g00020 [Theileria parva strain Muguga]|eukprot:XP_765547.1 hypothetical protein [Theileria parva strain Muguga]